MQSFPCDVEKNMVVNHEISSLRLTSSSTQNHLQNLFHSLNRRASTITSRLKYARREVRRTQETRVKWQFIDRTKCRIALNWHPRSFPSISVCKWIVRGECSFVQIWFLNSMKWKSWFQWVVSEAAVGKEDFCKLSHRGYSRKCVYRSTVRLKFS